MRGSLRHFLQYQNQHSIAQHAQPSARFPNVDDGKIDRKPTRLRVKPMVFYLDLTLNSSIELSWDPQLLSNQRIHSTMFFFLPPETGSNPTNWSESYDRSKKCFQKNCQWTMRRLSSINCVSYIYIWYIITKNHIWLVGGIPTPLKNHGVKVSWDDDIPNIWSSHLLADVSRRLSETLDLRKKRPRKRQV